MSNLQILKNRADLLFKDSKTRTVEIRNRFGNEEEVIEYHPKHFDIESLFELFGYDKEDQLNFNLSKAQHMIAQLANKKNWQELVKTPDEDLCIPALLVNSFKNADDVRIWLYHLESHNFPNEKRYEDAVNDYVSGKINVQTVVKERVRYIESNWYDKEHPNERPEDFIVEKLEDGRYYASIRAYGIPHEFENVFGETEDEACDKAARFCLRIIENSYITEILECCDRDDWDRIIYELKENRLIQDFSEKIQELPDNEGNLFYKYRCSCKRLMRHFSHCETSYDKDEAIDLAEEALCNDIWHSL